ncbi:MAG: hypothetical protein J5695_08215, partial [Bacteroidales bacterium]|nr:hypothetical protein [Bacteroidales bacterium]
ACYNDAVLKSDISDLQDRVRVLEAQYIKANENIVTLQSLVDALNGKVYVTSVTETSDGWIVKFSDGKTATITNGVSPKIGVKKDSDGKYYWTLNGEWLLGADGEKLPVEGEDGAPGQDAISPQLKIENDYWYVSTDGGTTWTQLGQATGDPGKDGDSIFQWVNQDESYWYFALANGDVIKIGRGIHGAKAVNVIPSFSDGSVIANKGKFTMSFDVLPAEAAEGLAEESNDIFNVKVVYTAPTKASNSISLPILSKEGKEGVLLLTVDGSKLDDSFVKGTSGASACLQIVWNDNVMSSGYFPLHPYDPYNGHEFVDLGLPSGLKWATCNVGASKPEDYGDYFAWGETEPKSDYTWNNYKWCNGSANTLTKYNNNKYIGTVDNKTVLDPEDDAARVNWGGSWRMPTDAEQNELRENCSWTWTTLNGVDGVIVTGSNGNSIFLSAAGYMDFATLFRAGSDGYYLSLSVYTGGAYDAFSIYFDSGHVARFRGGRAAGLPVRPVCD